MRQLEPDEILTAKTHPGIKVFVGGRTATCNCDLVEKGDVLAVARGCDGRDDQVRIMRTVTENYYASDVQIEECPTSQQNARLS